MLAAMSGHLAVVRVLLSARADLTRRNRLVSRPAATVAASTLAGKAADARLQTLGLRVATLELGEIPIGKSARDLAGEYGHAHVLALLRAAAAPDGLGQIQVRPRDCALTHCSRPVGPACTRHAGCEPLGPMLVPHGTRRDAMRPDGDPMGLHVTAKHAFVHVPACMHRPRRCQAVHPNRCLL